MPSAARPGLLLLLTLFTAAGAGCASGGPAAARCESDATCPLEARCVSGGCVANAPPVAQLGVPPTLETFALVTFDAGASYDPDAPLDGITAYEWTFRSRGAPCDPPAVASAAPQATVRFGCPGAYAVELVVVDRLGARSVVRNEALDVRPSTAPSVVRVGPDVATDHACAGEPLRCAPTDAVALSATAPTLDPARIRFHWTVTPPPGRSLDATRRVRLEPSADAPAPTAVIESDGTAISGDWIFEVEVRDDAGVLGVAAARASVGNRPPVITETVPTFEHAFDAPASRFIASGAIGVSVVDPDGDPVEARGASWRHSGDGAGATFRGEDLGDRLSVEIAVPYAAPTDAAHLIGGPGLERTVELVVRDVNGAEARGAYPVVVSNRPPQVDAPPPATVIVGHSFDRNLLRYQATATLSRWADPDGDPLAAAPLGDEACASGTLLADGTLAMSCALAFTGVPQVNRFAGYHAVTERARDPWAATSAPDATWIFVQNAPPTAGSTAGGVAVSCPTNRDPDLCCHLVLDQCVAYPTVVSATPYTFQPDAGDPDGDPIEIRYGVGITPASSVCLPGSCPAATGELAVQSGCGVVPEGATVPFTVSDGAATSDGAYTVTRTCL